MKAWRKDAYVQAWKKGADAWKRDSKADKKSSKKVLL